MIFRKKRVKGNDELAMKLAIMADRDFLYNRNEDSHDRNIMEIARIAKLAERLAEMEKIYD